jgi:thioredoxin-like negative regulator of GroEL
MAPQAQSARRAGVNSGPKAVAVVNSGADAEAYAKLNAGQVDEAVTAFQAVLAAQPNDASALAGMGQARILQGNYLGAVSFLERAKQASPNDAAIGAALDGARFQFLMNEGKGALTAKDSGDAEKRYREALELQPGARQAVNGLVNVLVMENKLGDAQDALSTAVAHDAAASGHPPAELELQLAQLDIANSQPQLAYPIFLQVLQDSPQRVDAWSGLISALHLMGHDIDAVAQERMIPADSRAQLEATPGFGQMMAGMATAAASPAAAGEPVYEPFIPSAAPVAPPSAPIAAPAVAATVTVPATSASATSLPMTRGAQHGPPSAQHLQTQPRAFAKPGIVRPANTPAAPKPVAAPTQSSGAPAATAQTATPSRPSSGSGAPLVTQPAARPAGRVEDIPDTGEQQYPQPKARPRAAANNN